MDRCRMFTEFFCTAYLSFRSCDGARAHGDLSAVLPFGRTDDIRWDLGPAFRHPEHTDEELRVEPKVALPLFRWWILSRLQWLVD